MATNPHSKKRICYYYDSKFHFLSLNFQYFGCRRHKNLKPNTVVYKSQNSKWKFAKILRLKLDQSVFKVWFESFSKSSIGFYKVFVLQKMLFRLSTVFGQDLWIYKKKLQIHLFSILFTAITIFWIEKALRI